jgi:signal transduction histidine kinase
MSPRFLEWSDLKGSLRAADAHPVESNRPTVIALAALLVLLAAAVTFARSDQSLRVAEDASLIAAAEDGRGAAATYRANLTIAVVAAASDSHDSARSAVAAAGRALDRIGTAIGEIRGGFETTVSDIASTHAQIAAALESGNAGRVDSLVSDVTLPALDDLQVELARIAADASARIDAEHASAGQTARVSSFVVALIAPVLALWAFRRNTRRRIERAGLDAELARQRDLAEAQQDLISGLSHQLRTPLTGIYGFAEAVVAESSSPTPDPSLVAEAGRTILSEANHLRAMVDDILVTARAAHGDLAYSLDHFDLRSEVDAAVEPFRHSGAVIEVDCEPATVPGDRLRVRHVLRNLIDNAIRHGRAPVRIVGRTAEGFELAVCDGGDGPDSTDVFRSFAHAPSDTVVTGSLGLGLGVCRTLCDGMDIGLRMVSDPGHTRFVLSWAAVADTQPIRSAG